MDSLADYHGVLDEDTAAELEAIVDRRRAERPRAHRERIEELDLASN